MPVKSRWTTPVPNCSVQQWVFGSRDGPISDHKAFIDADRPDTHYITFSNYRLLAKRIAVGLEAAGVKPGDRVLMFSGNTIFFPAVFLGIMMTGAVFTGANPGYVARELAHQVRDSGASIIIANNAGLDTAVEVAAQVGLTRDQIFSFDNTLPDAKTPENSPRHGVRHWTELIAPVADGDAYQWVEPQNSKESTCCLNYSSGTTGLAKGVEISHHSYVANGVGVIAVAEKNPDDEEVRKRTVGLCFLPLYHTYGQTFFITIFPRRAVPVYVMPAFDFLKMLSHIQKFRVTVLTAVPPIVVALTKHPLTKKFDLSSLEQVGCGAAPLGAETAIEAQKLLVNSKAKVRQGWGMTEVTCTCLSWAHDGDPLSNGVGEVMPNCQAKLMDLDGNTEITAPNTPGELWVSGPTVMRGYWKNPKATNDTIIVDADGTRWLKTGDIAHMDQFSSGAIFSIVDRLKELIKVKGNQVAPAELEALLLERSDVADAAVVGVTIQGEERPRAYIVKKEGANTTEKEIAEWVASRAIQYKHLRGGVAFVDAIPKNPSGKILRNRLRKLAVEEVGDREAFASKL